MPEGAKYIVPSYVCGQQGMGLDSPGSVGVPRHRFIPRTIADTLTVTRKLGYKSLWVDRYCIDQHNEHDKAHLYPERKFLIDLTVLLGHFNVKHSGQKRVEWSRRPAMVCQAGINCHDRC
jgi:hypothetical protein